MNEQARMEQFFEAYRQQRRKEIRQEIRDYGVSVSFGERLLRLRRLRGMRQRDLALALGVSVRTIIRHERGQCDRSSSLWASLREMEMAHAEEIVSCLEMPDFRRPVRGIETRFG